MAGNDFILSHINAYTGKKIRSNCIPLRNPAQLFILKVHFLRVVFFIFFVFKSNHSRRLIAWRGYSGKLFGFSIGDQLMSCTPLQKAAKPVWPKQLTRLPCLVVYVNFQFVYTNHSNLSSFICLSVLDK